MLKELLVLKVLQVSKVLKVSKEQQGLVFKVSKVM